MKIISSKVKRFLEKPDALSGVLIYGSDNSRVDFYTREIVANLVGYSTQVVDFTVINKLPDLLLSELVNISMFSDKRLIKIINVQGNISRELKTLLDHHMGSHYMMMIASELAYNSPTKNYMENSKIFGAFPCHKDNNSNLYDIISGYLNQNDIKYTNELIYHLQSYFNHSKVLIRPELEKLVLYLGNRKDLKLTDIESCFSISGNNYATLDGLCSAIVNKDVNNFIRISDTLIFHENFSSIALIRIISNYCLRIETVLLLKQSGIGEQEAIDQLNPPLFFKQLRNFKSHLTKLRLSELAKILESLINLEIICKKTDLDHKMLFQHKVSKMLSMQCDV